jgi:glycyl-tRNA synthetase beta chain
MIKVKSLLVEFFVEEIPANQLLKMRDAFLSVICNSLKDYLVGGFNPNCGFISYKRFGLLISGIDPQKSVSKRVKGPAISSADTENSPALAGFCRKYNITDLGVLEKDQDGYFYFTVTESAEDFVGKLSKDLIIALKKMTNTVMTWEEHQFIRPIRNLMVLLDDEVLPIEIFGCKSTNHTYVGRQLIKDNHGHNLDGAIDYQQISIGSANSYFEQMASCQVYPNFEERQNKIKEALDQYCTKHNLKISTQVPSSLLDEVTGLVESPLVLIGNFDEIFLKVPAPVLILTMAKNQKYFALAPMDCKNEYGDEDIYKLDNRFLLVADMSYPLLNKAREKLELPQLTDNEKSAIAQKIIADNQQVLTARLVDAQFFYNQDFRLAKEWFESKYGEYVTNDISLLCNKLDETGAIFEYFNEKLKHQVYNAKLLDRSTQWDRLQRIIAIKDIILDSVSSPEKTRHDVKIATLLSKFDLTTSMVGEFPELQGYIGAQYYSDFIRNMIDVAKPGEQHAHCQQYLANEVVNAVLSQYRVFTDIHSQQKQSLVANILILADKIEHILSMWLVGNAPTSEKDPYGVRRSALSLLGVLTHDNIFAGWNISGFWELLSLQIENIFGLSNDKYQTLIAEINQFLLQRYKMLFKYDDPELFNSIINKIQDYKCLNLGFGAHTFITQELYKIIADNLGYKQLLKRIHSLIGSKPQFLEECKSYIKLFEEQWYGNCRYDIALTEVYQKQQTDRNCLQSYDTSALLKMPESARSLRDMLLGITTEQLTKEYFAIVRNLVPLTNQLLDDTLVFDETDQDSQFYQTLLRLSYTILGLYSE